MKFLFENITLEEKIEAENNYSRHKYKKYSASKQLTSVRLYTYNIQLMLNHCGRLSMNCMP